MSELPKPQTPDSPETAKTETTQPETFAPAAPAPTTANIPNLNIPMAPATADNSTPKDTTDATTAVKQGEKPEVLPIEAKFELKDLLNFWMHQNTLMWGRLQTLTALQLPVIGGWYYLESQGKHTAAVLLASLGTILSLVLWLLISCDSKARLMIRDKITSIRTDIIPKPEGVIRGWILIQFLGIGFLVFDGVMLVVAATRLYDMP